MYYKYPKTWHIPASKPNPHGNDRVVDDLSHFKGKEVVITEKLDGENTTLYPDYIHARSIDSGHHPSRSWIKGMHAAIKHRIPSDLRLCGENMQAKHAIFYKALPTYFFLFGVWRGEECLSWEETERRANEIGVYTVPVLYKGMWDERAAGGCYTGKSTYDGEQEGYVIRVVEAFTLQDFSKSVNKYVRPGHVAGDQEHWSKTSYKPNRLKWT